MKKKTKKQSRNAIAFLLFLVGVALAYWKRQWIKAKVKKLLPAKEDTTGDDPPKSLPAGDEESTKSVFPLKYGAKGTVVKSLQAMLNHKHNAGLKVDGILGQKTKAALIKAGYSLPLAKDIYQQIITP